MKYFILSICCVLLIANCMQKASAAETFECSSDHTNCLNDRMCKANVGGGSTWLTKQEACDDWANILDEAFGATRTYTCLNTTGAGTCNSATLHYTITAGGEGTQNVTFARIGYPCTGNDVWDPATNQCVAPPACDPPAVWDADLQFCVTPRQCDAGLTHTGPIQTAGSIVNSACFSGCAYTLNNFEFISDSLGQGHYVSDGTDCTGAPPQAEDTLPDPVDETPIEPTVPVDEVIDDGDNDPEPATDENQEQMSEQLGGIQDQLRNLEGAGGQTTSQLNTTNSLLTEIANELKEAEAREGDEQGDEDGDGEEDSFGDAACAAPPSCNGDTLKCAIAEQAYYTKCNLQDETVDITEADVMAQTGTVQTIEEIFDQAAPENQIDITDYWTVPGETTGSCPADYSVSTSLGSFSFSWSYLCDLGTAVRPIVILSGYILVALMFYGSLVREWG